MVQVFPDVGLIYALQQIIANDMEILLFTNNITPDHTTTLAALTEAGWGGYARWSVLSGDWITPRAAGGVASTVAPPGFFANTSGSNQQAYGYAMYVPSYGEILLATRFDSAPITIADGTSKIVIPTLGDFTGAL